MKKSLFRITLSIFFMFSILNSAIASHSEGITTEPTKIDLSRIHKQLHTLLKSTGISWHRVYRYITPTTFMVSYIPENQKLGNWDLMIQYKISPQHEFNRFPYVSLQSPKLPDTVTLQTVYKQTLQHHCKNAVWRTIKQEPNHSIFEFNITNCKLWGSQYKVQNIILNNGNFESLTYIDKSHSLQKDKRDYSKLITTFQWPIEDDKKKTS